MTKYSNRTVTTTVWINEGSDNRSSDNQCPTVYHSQSSNLAKSLSLPCNLLNMIDGCTHLLICGNFGFPNIDWSFITGDNSHTQAFVETIQDTF